MKRICSSGLALMIGTLILALPAGAFPGAHSLGPAGYYGGTLGKIGKAIAYPVKKSAGNTSKTVNKTGKAAAYPVNKAARNTGKAVRKATH